MNKHPSMPVPLELPVSINTKHQPSTKQLSMQIDSNLRQYKNNIDIDDIINDLIPEQKSDDDMDAKLQKLNALHKKILLEKKVRQQQKERGYKK